MAESLSEQRWGQSPKPEERPSLEAVGLVQAAVGKVASHRKSQGLEQSPPTSHMLDASHEG